MTKVIKSKYKASRRLGATVWGNNKDAFHKRNYRPGQHGASTISKPSDYGIHLNAKQLLKAHYGRVSEKQFRNTFELAQKLRGNTGENFIALLESRLDMVVYRMNLAPTIFSARQIVTHGHILVNGKKTNIPSYRLKKGDVVKLAESSTNIPLMVESVSKAERRVPDYLTLNNQEFSGTFVRKPIAEEVPYPFEHKIHLVIELYSR